VKILRRVTVLLCLFVFLAPVIVLAEPNSEKGKIVLEQLAKDLAELQRQLGKMFSGPVVPLGTKELEEFTKELAEWNELAIQLQRQLEKMTPEERKQWCKDTQEKMEKSLSPIPILFNCN